MAQGFCCSLNAMSELKQNKMSSRFTSSLENEAIVEFVSQRVFSCAKAYIVRKAITALLTGPIGLALDGAELELAVFFLTTVLRNLDTTTITDENKQLTDKLSKTVAVHQLVTGQSQSDLTDTITCDDDTGFMLETQLSTKIKTLLSTFRKSKEDTERKCLEVMFSECKDTTVLAEFAQWVSPEVLLYACLKNNKLLAIEQVKKKIFAADSEVLGRYLTDPANDTLLQHFLQGATLNQILEAIHANKAVQHLPGVNERLLTERDGAEIVQLTWMNESVRLKEFESKLSNEVFLSQFCRNALIADIINVGMLHRQLLDRSDVQQRILQSKYAIPFLQAGENSALVRPLLDQLSSERLLQLAVSDKNFASLPEVAQKLESLNIVDVANYFVEPKRVTDVQKVEIPELQFALGMITDQITSMSLDAILSSAFDAPVMQESPLAAQPMAAQDAPQLVNETSQMSAEPMTLTATYRQPLVYANAMAPSGQTHQIRGPNKLAERLALAKLVVAQPPTVNKHGVAVAPAIRDTASHAKYVTPAMSQKTKPTITPTTASQNGKPSSVAIVESIGQKMQDEAIFGKELERATDTQKRERLKVEKQKGQAPISVAVRLDDKSLGDKQHSKGISEIAYRHYLRGEKTISLLDDEVSSLNAFFFASKDQAQRQEISPGGRIYTYGLDNKRYINLLRVENKDVLEAFVEHELYSDIFQLVTENPFESFGNEVLRPFLFDVEIPSALLSHVIPKINSQQLLDLLKNSPHAGTYMESETVQNMCLKGAKDYLAQLPDDVLRALISFRRKDFTGAINKVSPSSKNRLRDLLKNSPAETV